MDGISAKKELLSEIEREWAVVERVYAGFSDEALIAPGVQGDWSFKDILVHLSAWEKYLLDRLGYVMSNQPPQYPSMSSWDDVHRFNAQVYAANQGRPLNSVILEFRSLYHGVMTVLEALDDWVLGQHFTYDFPDDGLTVLMLIRANTVDHYREHFIALEEGK